MTANDHRNDHRGDAVSDLKPTGPGGCNAALNIVGEHYWCDMNAPHPRLAHASAEGEAIWFGKDEAAEAEAAWVASGAEEAGR